MTEWRTDELGEIVGAYIDVGDVVRIRQDPYSQHLQMYRGERGKVISNDGRGLCEVHLDNGRIFQAWNAADLERA